jgi:signal transduction histidine kinase
MWNEKHADEGSKPWRLPLMSLLALWAFLFICPSAATAGPPYSRTVVVLYPVNADQSPGRALFDQGIRSTFEVSSRVHVVIYNEYVDDSRLPDTGQLLLQADYLQRKYAGRKVDLVITCSSTMDFVLKFREKIFPSVPVVAAVVDEQELQARKLPADVLAVLMKRDMTATLDLARRLHPNTRYIFVITGNGPYDTQLKAEARKAFRSYEDNLEFHYLSGLPMVNLLQEVARLPDCSIIFYLCVSEDGAGQAFVSASVLERLAPTANAPIYSIADSYLGRGIVGGQLYGFNTEGNKAARLGLRILEGEKPETISVPETSENPTIFDWRQLRRWDIGEERLPPGSIVRYKEPDFWDLYKWHVAAVISLCVLEALLIVGLLVQRASRRQAEEGLRASQHELRVLNGELVRAQETERRRIARDLHDDLNQSLALLSVELDLLSQKPPELSGQVGTRLQELSGRVKQLSASVHALSHQLHPLKLEQMGLVPAVGGLCRELSQSQGLPIVFTHDQMPEALTDDTALCLYRIVQEALRNVIKHSGAHQASVDLHQSADGLCLRIVDDGAGFDPAKVPGGGGLGLVSMRERLHLVRGHITVDSQPSRGTCIDVCVPLCSNGQADRTLSAHPAGLG